MKLSLLLLLIISACVSVTIAAEPTLESLKQTYETEVHKIRDEHEQTLSGLLDSYGKSLDKAIEILKKEGDPDKALTGIAEKKRFEDEKAVPSKVDEKLPPVIQKCQEGYRSAARELSIEKAKRFLDLTNKYVRALNSSMRSLTADGEFGQAVKLKEEKERVGFALADVEMKLKVVGGDMSKPATKDKMPLSLRRGLVLHYGFDEDEGKKVTDLSEMGNDGKVYGAKWVGNGRIGGACAFDGKNDYINTTLRFSNDHRAVSLWVKLDRTVRCIPFGIYAPRDRYYFGYRKSGALGLGLGVSSFDKGVTTHQADTEWHHLLVTWSGTDVKLYVDTNHSITKTGRVSLKASYFIGAINNITRSPSDYLDGLVDEVMIWNRALSEAEIKQVYRLTGGK